MVKKFSYTPVLGWSASRYERFEACKRQYYYDYYGKYDRECPEGRIEKLKRLTSVPLEIGNMVHHGLQFLLERLQKTGSMSDIKRFIARMEKKARETFRSSSFSETYYNPDSVIDMEQDFLNKIEPALQNFLSGSRYQWITGNAIRSRSEWLIEPPGFGEARLNGLKVYFKVDFLVPLDGHLYIMDWKTGRKAEEKHRKQLLGYVTWASYHYEKDPEHIIPILSYLKPSYEEVEMKFTRADVEEFAVQVRRETEEMYGYCRDAGQNIPAEKSLFTLTVNRELCNYCNYRELCR